MCNKISEIETESKLKPEVPVNQYLMNDPIVVPGSARSSNEEKPRVKFLCSFSGSILPRPHDGKLRYVGGETRIVSLPCDIKYEELMAKMREIYDNAVILKYQQPDEDLDALVSVVNDDDVTNMMEEYDKLGAGDGFTKLRVFLFSHSDLDGSVHFVDGDEKESERRYMEALNSLNESPNYMRNNNNEPQVFSPADDGHNIEQFLNQMNLESGGLHNQRNNDLHLPPIHLRQLNIPPLMSAQSISQMESPWSYHSPRQQPSVLEPRQVAEYPTSPSSSHYHAQYAEFSDKNFDRIYEEYNRNQTNQSIYDQQHQQQYNNTGSMFPTTVPNERSGFPVNLMGSSTNVFDGNNICNNCRVTFPRNQLFSEPFYQTHTEQPQTMVTPCAECLPNREMYMLNDHRHVYNENQSRDRERGWNLQQQVTPRGEELRLHNNGDNNNNTMGFSHLPESPHVPFHLVHYDDPHYIRSGPEVSNQVFHDTPLAPGSNVHHIQPMAHPPYAIRTDGVFQVGLGHGHGSSPSLWRNVQSPMHGGPPSYEPSGPPQLANNGLINPWIEASPKNLGLDNEAHRLSNAYNPENGLFHCSSGMPTSAAPLDPSVMPAPVSLVLNRPVREEMVEPSSLNEFICASQKIGSDGLGNPVLANNTTLASVANNSDPTKAIQSDNNNNSVSLAIGIGCVDDVKSGPDINGGGIDAPDALDVHEDIELDSEIENSDKKSKIELTKAEEEALSRGLQTIRNEDLEEIRELGTGTYGAVYHGKWKGSDVAIKRIKASCFNGRPSERERLISDFWKEALILSSLHHPNVVSFYGVVRDGPDGSLATVTEFMVNGSLKQFLQKKDRTIDRRKRLLIGMDTAFGMEYLHAKSIVHFDLKCENLLVNMRDPHRPVCKIGDLGLSKVKQHTLVSGGIRGTLPWMAPELLSGTSNMVTEKIDVYSFGIVMWELLTGDEPYKDMHCASIIGGIVNNTLRPTIPTWCDPEWKTLMESCWSSDLSIRPSFSEISQKLRSMAAAMNLK